ncbi:MAG: hypothetical protein JWN75_309 [Candidatus Saccharibacteria bacterium]|nr:hypothetical protein [Candidatus Saccharibacteria bacterium]
MLQKFRFVSSIAAIYILTIGTISGLLYSSHLFGMPVWAVTKPVIVHHKPIKLAPKVISGKPVRIVIASSNIDLPIDEGTYDQATGAWTLSDTHAQFATMTAIANDSIGTTFIYGHGTDAVFGKIGTNHPAVGTIAQIYTDTSHVFSYTLQEVRDMQPTDTSILQDTSSGSPRLVVQTCTGIFSEWRTMFIFSFEKVL